MPVIRVGDYCSRCLVRPAIHDGICRPCEELRRCFPDSALVRAAEDRARVVGDPLTELEVDLTISVSRQRFHDLVWEWIDRA